MNTTPRQRVRRITLGVLLVALGVAMLVTIGVTGAYLNLFTAGGIGAPVVGLVLGIVDVGLGLGYTYRAYTDRPRIDTEVE